MSNSDGRPPPKPKSTQTRIQPPQPPPPSKPMNRPLTYAEWQEQLKSQNKSKSQPTTTPVMNLANKSDIPNSSSSAIILPESEHKHNPKWCGNLADLFECGGCDLKCRSERYKCTTCHKQFHTECLTFKKTENGHKHEYKLRSYNKIFECDGCKEEGFGKRIRCDQCGHELHTVCKFAEDPGYVKWLSKLPFKFHNEEKKSEENLICYLCTNEIEGNYYQNDGFYLHPCCIAMEPVLFAGSKEELKSANIKDERRYTLSEKVKYGTKCYICYHWELRRPDPGWSYVCHDGTHCYHVYCLQKVVREAWVTANGVEDIPKAIENFASKQLNEYTSSSTRGSSYADKTWKIFIVIVKMIASTLMGDPTFGFVHLAGVLINGF